VTDLRNRDMLRDRRATLRAPRARVLYERAARYARRGVVLRYCYYGAMLESGESARRRRRRKRYTCAR